MNDLISRQAAIEAIDKYFDDLPIQRYYDMVQIIENSTAIDAVPVVRCKDCKWHNAKKAGELYRCDLRNVWEDGDFFCANGERSEE